MVINKLTREFVNSRREVQGNENGDPSTGDRDELDDVEIIKRRIIHILKFVGWNALKFLKNFAVSLITFMFIVCVLKRMFMWKEHT